MNHLIIAQIIVTIAYLIYVIRKVGVQYSISNSWYALRLQRKEGYFNAWIASLGILNMCYLSYHYSIPVLLLCFTGGFMLFAVGVFDRFKQSKRWTVGHNISAIGAMIISIISTCIHQHIWWWPLVAIIGLIGLIYGTKIKNPVWWMECSVIGITFIGLLII